MIRLGLRLTVAGGRDALARLVITALGTALGVGMLLTVIAGLHGVTRQNDRYAWLETGSQGAGRSATAHADPLWWLLSADEYRGRLLGRVDVAATGPDSPVPPGIPRLPGPGEYYASPALAELVRTVPHDQLADRFPGHLAGTIGPAGVPAPGQLVAVVGHRPNELAGNPHAEQVDAISRVGPGQCHQGCLSIGIDSQGIRLVLAVTAVALLFPVLIFVGAASRLSAARREQRFAALRLVGATPRQISVVATVESIVAAVAGVLLGFGTFLLLRPELAGIDFTGAPFYQSDFAVTGTDAVAVALGIPVAAAVAARVSLRRVTISPLGVSRRATPPPPRAWRLLPLLAGLAELGWFVVAGRPDTTDGQILAYTSGILVTLLGLVLAGPWLTVLGGRLVSGRTGRPAALIAGRRLADDPRAGFRAVSGLVLALFVGTVAVAVITTIEAYDGGSASGPQAQGTLVARFDMDVQGGRVSIPARPGPATTVPASLVTRLRALPGVRGLALVHRRPDAGEYGWNRGVVSCADLAGTPALGTCPAGARSEVVDLIFDGGRRFDHGNEPSPLDVASLPVTALVLDAQGAPATVERARTLLQRAYPLAAYPSTIAEEEANYPDTQRLAQYRQLADVVILASLPIAGCSLAVTVAAGLSERRRPFGLLRLAGTPLPVLRRVVALESAVPMLAVAAVAVGVSFLAAAMFLRSQLGETLQPPSGGYYAAVAGGVLASVAIIASTLPLLSRLTGPENVRND